MPSTQERTGGGARSLRSAARLQSGEVGDGSTCRAVRGATVSSELREDAADDVAAVADDVAEIGGERGGAGAALGMQMQRLILPPRRSQRSYPRAAAIKMSNYYRKSPSETDYALK